MKRYEPSEAVKTLKRALDAVSTYKKDGDSMRKQLSSQEREIRKIHNECTEQIKANRKKEKQRAMAMFGGAEEKKDCEKNKSPTAKPQKSLTNTEEDPGSITKGNQSEKSVTLVVSDDNGKRSDNRTPPKKRVSFADGTSPGHIDGEEQSFFAEHMEALFIVTGITLGYLLVSMAWNKKR
jgi:hypothetical protein